MEKSELEYICRHVTDIVTVFVAAVLLPFSNCVVTNIVTCVFRSFGRRFVGFANGRKGNVRMRLSISA